MRKVRRKVCSSFLLSFLLTLLWNSAHAKTIVLEGSLDSRIAVTQRMSFNVDKRISMLEYRFALPAVFSNRVVHQDLQGLHITFDPEPAKVSDETDAFGNRFKKVVWKGLDRDAGVTITFVTHIRSELSAMESRAAFPLTAVPEAEA